MEYRKSIYLLTVIIIILSLLTSIIGILTSIDVFTGNSSGVYKIDSFHGDTVDIYGKGIYKHDSVSAVSQGVAQDIVTVIIGIPLLLISLYLINKSPLKGRLLLTGTLGYFLYTYTSYTFLWHYNSLFVVYTILMSISFFAFTMSMMSFDLSSLSSRFSEKLPVGFIGGFEIFFAFAIGMMWLGRIAPSVFSAIPPLGLEHYTTLVIQGLDLGFIVPVSMLAGILLIKRKPLGYLLSSVMIMKSITMATAVTAMVIGQVAAGTEIGLADATIFPIINLVMVFILWLLLKNINPENNSVELQA